MPWMGIMYSQMVWILVFHVFLLYSLGISVCQFPPASHVCRKRMTGFFSRLAIRQTASWYQGFLSRSSGKDDGCATAGCSMPQHAPADVGCSGFNSSRANPVFITLGASWHKKSRTKSGFFCGAVLRQSLSRRVRRRSPSSRFATRRRGSRGVCSGSGGSRRVPIRRSREWACPGRRRCPSAGCPGSGCW